MLHPGRALDLKTKDLIGYLWTSLFIDHSECLLYYLFCIQLPHFCTVWRKDCTVLSQSESSNFFMYIIITKTRCFALSSCTYRYFCYRFQPVGCDHVLNSDKMIDRCGKCGGDGDTCFIVSSNYTTAHKVKGNDKYPSPTV